VFVADGTLFILNLVDAGPVVWTSITPNAGDTTTFYYFTIAGTGFTASNVNQFKFDDGVTPIYEGLTIDSNIQITTSNASSFFSVGVYTLYFSTDSGVNWTTTGLTVTIT
jgi:hypothetical protein